MCDFRILATTDDFVAIMGKVLSAYVNIIASVVLKRKKRKEKKALLPQRASERRSLSGSRRWRAAAVKRSRRWQSRPATGAVRSATGLDSVGSTVIVAFAVSRLVRRLIHDAAQ